MPAHRHQIPTRPYKPPARHQHSIRNALPRVTADERAHPPIPIPHSISIRRHFPRIAIHPRTIHRITRRTHLRYGRARSATIRPLQCDISGTTHGTSITLSASSTITSCSKELSTSITGLPSQLTSKYLPPAYRACSTNPPRTSRTASSRMTANSASDTFRNSRSSKPAFGT